MKLNLLSLFLFALEACAEPVLQVLGSTRELSTLNFYINGSTSLTKLLSSADNFTFFAPSNAAFEKWLFRDEPTSSDVVESSLKYHLIHGRFPTLSFTGNSQFIHSFLDNGTYANVTGGQVMEIVSKDGQPQVVSGNKTISTIDSPPDLICAGGFIQIVNTFLETPLDIVQSISNFNLKNFIALLNAGNFVTAADSPLIQQVLKAPDITYFAPNTPEALASFSAAARNMTEKQISSFFGYHVVAGIAGYSSNLKDGMELKTLQGSDLKITVQDGQIYINSAKVIESDLLVANGVLHTIDSNLDRFNTTPPPRQASKETQAESNKSGLSEGAKAGTAIGVMIIVILIFAAAFFLYRRHRRLKEAETTKEINGTYTQELDYGGDQRLVHKSTGHELELDANHSYGSLVGSQKRWETSVDAVELDAGSGRR